MYNRKGVVTGIAPDFKKGLYLSPNPVKDKLYIAQQWGKQLEVLDIRGQLVYKKELLRGTTEIDFSSCPPGMYFVRLSNQQQSIVKKIIKE